MNVRRGVFKKDGQASAMFRGAYDEIPKSVFAAAAFHLAAVCSDSDYEDAIEGGGALKRFAEEVDALAAAGIITEAQGKTVLRALKKYSGMKVPA